MNKIDFVLFIKPKKSPKRAFLISIVTDFYSSSDVSLVSSFSLEKSAISLSDNILYH
ncbi:hypothetical protein SAMN05660866_00443 [Maribacter arcticus]|uniref:Uncharacterized protein n=1 Tax=Maribacter arcticus TaxID=561365 RepID=A0A1T4ZXG4_9FLAO|nr:hypothetical protein SAMN05660866_00443 [Maribacter arcticus]